MIRADVATTPIDTESSPPITITAAAATRLGQIMHEQSRADAALRVFVSGGGCSGLQYGMGFEPAPEEGDHVFTSAGLTVCVDPISVLYLQGATVDFVDAPGGSGFRIDNPNALPACGGCASADTDAAGSAGCGSCRG